MDNAPNPEGKNTEDSGGDTSTLFPASEATPGQRESRNAQRRFAEWAEEARRRRKAPDEAEQQAGWLDDYTQLRREGWSWREAVYIAWASSPAIGRWPVTQEALAVQVMGMRSDRAIRKWREKRPEIDERVSRMQAEPLLRHRRDVIQALTAVAVRPEPEAHRDRKLFLEMTGDYKRTGEMTLAGRVGVDLEREYQRDAGEISKRLEETGALEEEDE